MSDDLISREYLLNCAEYDDNGRLIIHYRKVKNAPTAFDKKKVMQELQEAADLRVEDGLWHVPLLDALEIVEKGGIK